MMIGDYDISKVVDGEDGIVWVGITDPLKWSIEDSGATFGDLTLVHHSFEEALIRPGTPGLGLPSEEYTKF